MRGLMVFAEPNVT